MSIAKGTPFDALFALLTEQMGVPVTATPDADPSQRDRIEWKQAGFDGLVQRGYRRPGTVTAGFTACKYDVSVYGATELEVLTRVTDLVGWIDRNVGPERGNGAGDGYAIGKSSNPVAGGDGAAAGFGCTVPITLYLPALQQIWGRQVVVSVPVTVSAVAPDGTQEQALP